LIYGIQFWFTLSFLIELGQMRPHIRHPFGLFFAAVLTLYPAAANAVELEPNTHLPGLSNINAYLPPLVAPIRLELNLSQRQVTFFRANQPIKSYPVAIGRPGWETPTGTFKLETMYRNPKWINPFTGELIPGGDTDNPLGRRWMGFWTDGHNWAGFHGTNSVTSIGTAASHGCVRMFEKDIEELFERVAVGTPVTVKR
jgi:L,D-transpeptidase ErfK/SrfK